MTVRLLDGPAAGEKMGLRRVPRFLRVVEGAVEVRIGGRRTRFDALDQLDDVPRADETVHVYEGVVPTLFALAEGTFVCVRGPEGLEAAATGSGEYRYRPDVDGEALRETEAWRAWARAQPEEPGYSTAEPAGVGLGGSEREGR